MSYHKKHYGHIQDDVNDAPDMKLAVASRIPFEFPVLDVPVLTIESNIGGPETVDVPIPVPPPPPPIRGDDESSTWYGRSWSRRSAGYGWRSSHSWQGSRRSEWNSEWNARESWQNTSSSSNAQPSSLQPRRSNLRRDGTPWAYTPPKVRDPDDPKRNIPCKFQLTKGCNRTHCPYKHAPVSRSWR